MTNSIVHQQPPLGKLSFYAAVNHFLFSATVTCSLITRDWKLSPDQINH